MSTSGAGGSTSTANGEAAGSESPPEDPDGSEEVSTGTEASCPLPSGELESWTVSASAPDAGSATTSVGASASASAAEPAPVDEAASESPSTVSPMTSSSSAMSSARSSAISSAISVPPSDAWLPALSWRAPPTDSSLAGSGDPAPNPSEESPGSDADDSDADPEAEESEPDDLAESVEPAEPVASANATAGSDTIAAPTPRMTANAPTRPTWSA